VQVLMAIFMVGATFVLIRPFGMAGVALASALTNVFNNYLCLRQVRAALQLSPYNRTYLRLLAPAAVSLALTEALRIVVRYYSLHPDWLWIVVALGISYASFSGLALLAGIDNDDKMIVDAVRGRVLGALGRMPSRT